MEEEELNRYRGLCLKNRKTLESLHSQISCRPEFLTHEIYNFSQIKQQYEIILAASRDSIDYNSQLQMELDLKQEQLRSLKIKLQRQNRELNGLANEISRASGHLRKERKSCMEVWKSQEDVEKIKKQISRLKRKKGELIREEASFQQKQQQIKNCIKKIDDEMVEMETRSLRESSLSSKRVEELQQEIRARRQQIGLIRQIASSRVKTPEKSMEKRKSFEELHLRIRQQIQKEGFE